MKTLATILAFALVLCSATLALAQSSNIANAASTSGFNPITLFAGGVGLVIVGACLGFVIGRNGGKKS